MYPERLLKKPFKLLPHGHAAAISAQLAALKPYVRQTGDQWRPPWHMPGRKLLDYLIVYIAEGAGVFTVGSETFSVGDGDLVWIPPDTFHEMEGFKPSMHCIFAHFDLIYDPARSHWDAHVPPDVLDLSAYADLMHPPLPHIAIAKWCGKMQLANNAAVGMLLERIAFEHERDPRKSALVLSGMMLEVIAEILKGLAAKVDAKGGFRWDQMQQSLRDIQNQAEKPLDISVHAEKMRLSESHFRKLFRETHGRSPRQVHREARIQRAKELLIYSSLTISEIADKLGFSSVHSLSRAFNAVTGISPRQFRNGT
jgi:AraC-like DNA-binding protein